MTLKRTPFPEGLPFEGVECERGYLHVQCTVCGGHRRAADLLAVRMLRSSRLGSTRLALQTPTIAVGAIRFVFGHAHCVQTHRGAA